MSIERAPTHYRTLSHVAANVAAAAALAAQQEEQMRRQAQLRHSHEADGADWGDDDEVDDAALARLTESFHSEGGPGRKTVSWSRERGGSVGRHPRPPTMSPISRGRATPQVHTSPALGGVEDGDFARGRSLAREVELPEDEWANTASAQRRSSRASRKGAGMVFLGTWALFGVGTFAGTRRGAYSSTREQVGRVLEGGELARVPPLASLGPTSASLGDILDQAVSTSAENDDLPPPLSFGQLRFVDEIPQDPHDDHGPSMDYIIGRISAWICTTLYLTSRLPQIWKNVSLFHSLVDTRQHL